MLQIDIKSEILFQELIGTFVFDQSKQKVKLFDSQEFSPSYKFWTPNVYTLKPVKKHIKLFEVFGPCAPKSNNNNLYSFDSHEWKEVLTNTYVTHSISIFFLLLTLFLFAFIPKLRSNIIGKFWIIFSTVSTINYSLVIILGIYLTNKELDPAQPYKKAFAYLKEGFSNQIFALYYFFEFAVYFWLVAICMELFLSIQ